jgi:hypothetical protein
MREITLLEEKKNKLRTYISHINLNLLLEHTFTLFPSFIITSPGLSVVPAKNLPNIQALAPKAIALNIFPTFPE